MSLADLWSISREQVDGKHVRQIIAFAGAGQLTDGGAGALEFREFLGVVPSEYLSRYATECLKESFPGSGFALQDVVNQIGRRLGYMVTDGRYRGTTNHVGLDGLWKFPDGHAVVVEVKTSDAYRFELGTVANYRRELITSGDVSEDGSSILIVVGREDTGDLEAQIRGSRYAWEIRLISVDALLRLMSLKERLDDPKTIQQICNILKPREFTRLDEIIDLVFSTLEETAEADPLAIDTAAEPEDAQERLPPVAFHEACISVFEKSSGKQLVRQTRSGYATPDGGFAVVCAVSKRHDVAAHPSYWFAFHPYQKNFLENAAEGVLVLGCGSAQTVLSIPVPELFSWLPDMWTTQRGGRMYWHIRVRNENNRYTWDRRAGLGRIDVTQYLLPG